MSTETKTTSTTSTTKKASEETEPVLEDAVPAADETVTDETVTGDADLDSDLDGDDDLEADADPVAAKPQGVGQGAAAVVAAGLGVVSLTGSWVGTVAAARSNLTGQLQTAQTAGVAEQIQALYGDQWHLTALIGGAFALLAVIIGVAVLVRPAFGAPGRAQAPWIKSVSLAGVGLGVIGLLLALAKYTDLILGLPAAS
ncbi:hypothetical protein [Streptomyces boluensis]|uniref:Uncharacterized protein n=1 Tax=Streptomyces boluensis TaxID=1775135 RepID=A0A964XKF8_9ACTN|nr:hypothetical protein [Streptomyces boluensis]NBE52195.1 hypothetical protein [Streptomyces boluensis]